MRRKISEEPEGDEPDLEFEEDALEGHFDVDDYVVTEAEEAGAEHEDPALQDPRFFEGGARKGRPRGWSAG